MRLLCFVVLAGLAPSEAVAAELSPEETAAGFVSLFDGETLNGWVGAVEGYAVEDGAITCIADKGGNLMSEKDYANFVLKLEFRLPAGGNNGIGLRVPLGQHAATQGMEIQVLDDSSSKYDQLKEYQYHGSIYGVVPAKRGFLKPVGEWNVQEIRCIGKQVTVILNGETIVDADIEAASTPMTLDGHEHPGLRRTTGRIGFLGHGSKVQFRNIRIQEIE